MGKHILRLSIGFGLILILQFISCNKNDVNSPFTANMDSSTAAILNDPQTIRDNVNQIVLVPRVPTDEVWNLISGAIKENELKGTRFLIPIKGKSGLYPYFMNLNNYPDHHVVLGAFFARDFPNITYDSYVTMAIEPAQRVFYSGNITERTDRNGNRIFCFTIWHHVSDPAKTISRAEVEGVYAALKSLFTVGELQFDPFSKNQRDSMKNWGNTSVPIYNQDELINGYEAYTATEAYGTLKFLHLNTFDKGIISSSVDYREIIVIDSAPFDIIPVVSGIVTGTRQGELSHLNVRLANRHIANCHISDPFNSLKKWENRLVHLVLKKDTWEIENASQADAKNWWNRLKPEKADIPPADRDFDILTDISSIPVSGAAERSQSTRRFGSKATQLAILYNMIGNHYKMSGFAIPTAWYFDFMKNNGWNITLGNMNGFHSFEETINFWLTDDKFQNDIAYRAQRLKQMRESMIACRLDPALLSLLDKRISDVFGNHNIMLRMRSSSNAEDSIFFSGAGLYESKTACIADDLDTDEIGPSRGDPAEKNEKPIAAALIEVWASLWNTQAFEERSWYSINHRDAGMAILVNARVKDEKVNMVIFTGNPGMEDNRFLFNAQEGDVDTVRSFGGIYPEKTFVTVAQGEVTKIERVSFSNTGTYDLYLVSKEQIRDISSLLWKVARDYPVDFKIPDGYSLLWDTEWKITTDNRIIVKQIRPFLRANGKLTGQY
ncbi:MAG: hypothetical protein EHM28_03205 [Spirochaetaceae bacterium]|nr:MAG: hypothetical protein EHM28_03205 [Spirochaetaceae bacterium]